ncbi:MAG: hypothetical protein HY815_20410 [Candidatus Riflebacteria bacterium]|nr:hypothetical protein [Candidatus Riflebacteria bacterium]
MEGSPAKRLLIYGSFFFVLICMAFGFFAMTGGSIKPGGTFGVRITDVMYEVAAPAAGIRPAAAPGAPERPFRELPTGDSHREPSVPETLAEEHYYSAIRKANDLETRQAERLKSREEVLRFNDTPLGKDLRAVAELARRGRTVEAGQYIPKVLEAMTDVDARVQTFALKLAMNIHKQLKDHAAVTAALKRYLASVRAHLSTSKSAGMEDKDFSKSLSEVETLISQVERAGGGGR